MPSLCSIRSNKQCTCTSDGPGLVPHCDCGVQYISIKYEDRLTKTRFEQSVGSFGDLYDNQLRETVSGVFKTKAIGP